MGDDQDLQGSVFALLRHRNAQSLKQGNRENNLERSQLRLLDGPALERGRLVFQELDRRIREMKK